MNSLSARLLAVVVVLSLAANVLLYFRYSTSRSLVTVGTENISKKQYLDQLEHQAGAEVLNKLVFTKLVTQAAAQAGVTPTAQDVDARIADIERRAPQLLAPYSQDPAKMAEFRQDLQTTIALENLRIKDVALPPAAVTAFYERERLKGPKGLFALPQQVKTTTVVTKNAVDAGTAEDLLRQKTPVDVIARQPRLSVVGINGYNPDLQTLSPALKGQISDYVQKAAVGGVKTFREGPYFLTFAVTKSSSAITPPLAQIHDQVERGARLERAPAPQEELARLYHASPPKFHYDADKYGGYFETIQKYQATKPGGQKTTPAP